MTRSFLWVLFGAVYDEDDKSSILVEGVTNSFEDILVDDNRHLRTLSENYDFKNLSIRIYARTNVLRSRGL